MTNEAVDHGRRRFLTATTAVVGAAGVVTAIVPFIKSWEPSARSKAAGAPITADISKVKQGQMLKYPWRGLPIFVVNRTKDQIATLSTKDVESRLRDPNSDETSQQPAYCKNVTRSIKPEWLVMIGICTHLGCVPLFNQGMFKDGWSCPCHGSQYDAAGRIRQGPAPLNLYVPPYNFVSDTKIKIG